jgi:hypothetical protein
VRKLLYALVGLVAIVVIAVGIASAFRRELLAYALTPPGAFDERPPPPAPDYGQRDSWAALPDTEDQADLVPPGAALEDNQADARADAFFIHPTTYYSRASWNAPVDDEKANAFTDWGTLGGQASAFNGCCRIYAPRYRQATLASFFRARPNGHQALELAYEDVLRAFTYYMEHFNNGRPFVVASHSQGTRHAVRLLEQVISGAPYRGRFVAAYLIGGRVPVDKFQRTLRNIGPCGTAEELGCVVGWDTYVDGGTSTDPPDEAGYWYPTGHEPVHDKRWLCTNPLTWATDEGPARAEFHLGAVAMTASEGGLGLFGLFSLDPATLPKRSLRPPIVGHSGAQCRAGILYIPRPEEKAFNRIVLDGGSYHMYDYGLFYMNIRKNAQDRVAAYSRSVAPATSPVR